MKSPASDGSMRPEDGGAGAEPLRLERTGFGAVAPTGVLGAEPLTRGMGR